VFSSIFPAEAKESALCAGSTGIGNHLINMLPVAGLLFLLLAGVISHPLCPSLHLTKLIHSSLLSVYIPYTHSHPFHFLPPWAHLIAAIDEFNCANYCADFVPQRCCLVPFPPDQYGIVGALEVPAWLDWGLVYVAGTRQQVRGSRASYSFITLYYGKLPGKCISLGWWAYVGSLVKTFNTNP